ncbi:MAG: glycosyltransferase family 2 protein [Lentisphaeria bacterium]|nr:glycosyltransferase family 2 protein [Lentisphaeria bacterium]
MDTLTSVLIPAYNHEKYVQDAIKSIMEQTYQNIELIVVDDGSKDDTWQKIQEMRSECEKRFTRVHLETKENEGTCKTLNKLLSISQGEFIYLIASDDMAKPQAVEKELDFLIHNPDYVLCVGDNEIIDGENELIGWDNSRRTISLEKAKFKTFVQKLQYDFPFINFNSDNFGNYSNLLKGNHVPNGYLIRKSALKNFQHTPEAPLEDLFMMLQLSKTGKFKYLDEILFSYRWHQTNTAAQKDYMIKMMKQTYLYERKILTENENQKLLEIFNIATENYRIKFHIGNLIKYYCHNTIEYKENILEIFGKKIQVKYKNFLED